MGFFAELKRRNVFRVGAAYLVVAWLLMQVTDTVVPALHLPGWIVTAVVLFLMGGSVEGVMGSNRPGLLAFRHRHLRVFVIPCSSIRWQRRTA